MHVNGAANLHQPVFHFIDFFSHAISHKKASAEKNQFLFLLYQKNIIFGDLFSETDEPFAKVGHSVIPAKAGIQNRLKILDSGSRFACPE
jgi:hypothetical protein